MWKICGILLSDIDQINIFTFIYHFVNIVSARKLIIGNLKIKMRDKQFVKGTFFCGRQKITIKIPLSASSYQ